MSTEKIVERLDEQGKPLNDLERIIQSLRLSLERQEKIIALLIEREKQKK